MDTSFTIQDRELVDKYPDIKVLREVDPVRVASCRYYGQSPERGAYETMRAWVLRSGFRLDPGVNRLFGYDNPSPTSPEQTIYGYELCLTLGDMIVPEDPMIQIKTLEGGLYAVKSIERSGIDMGAEVICGWDRLEKWMEDGRYVHGGHQWMEAYWGFDRSLNHVGGVDLYMPVLERTVLDTQKHFELVEPMWTASYKVNKSSAADHARSYLLEWADREGLFRDGQNHRFFAHYDPQNTAHDEGYFRMHVSVDPNFRTSDPSIVVEEFRGGTFAVIPTKFKHNGKAWSEFLRWISGNKSYACGDEGFMESYEVKTPEIDAETPITLYMSVRKKD